MDVAYTLQEDGEGGLDLLDTIDRNFVHGFRGLSEDQMAERLDALPAERMVAVDPPALGLSGDRSMPVGAVIALIASRRP